MDTLLIRMRVLTVAALSALLLWGLRARRAAHRNADRRERRRDAVPAQQQLTSAQEAALAGRVDRAGR
ncbi:hypothetical protein [Streptomyces sp. NPDC002553]|uniref:hypothetical protein n=1 Tax=Streptomyces sp. NPDC002553 TaxID=3154417 RepID=UPI003328AB53